VAQAFGGAARTLGDSTPRFVALVLTCPAPLRTVPASRCLQMERPMSSSPTPLVIHSIASAPWFLHVHLGLALAALVIGLVLLLGPKGTLPHRALGWTWALLMVGTAIVSFWIQARGHLSWIHALSVVVLVSVPAGLRLARRHDRRGHAITMSSTFAGLVIAGAFTLLPYRMLGQWLWG
jgi:uncharacterized membrane protein